ncbi:MAG: pyridoxamine kinase [Oscillospiraceae bacterium]|nr:pyridoxamine kinase [Oscillospiraceae bacterium]
MPLSPPPRVLAIHDLSGVGKCSLTVALPILSAMGAEVAALPTAVLSTHTGDLSGFTCRDLTDDLLPAARHWQSLGLRFRAMYTGWLASARQARIVGEIIEMLATPDTLRLIDPVMGDQGRLYSTYTPERVAGMAALCRGADVITPNLTEAALLLNEAYRPGLHTPGEARALCERLLKLGARRVVVTGIATGENRLGAAALDAAGGGFSLHEMPRLPGIWYGTGDIFGSVLLGGLLRGQSLSEAAALAVDFTQSSIARTHAQGTDPRFGVDFEHGLGAL